MELLTEPWWQGIAGVAQILAAVFAAWVIYKTARQRREGVMPVLDIAGTSKLEITCPGDKTGYMAQASVSLVNTGFGPARNMGLKINSYPNNALAIGKGSREQTWPQPLMPAEKCNLTFKWGVADYPVAQVAITYHTALRHREVQRFAFRANYGPTDREVTDWSFEKQEYRIRAWLRRLGLRFHRRPPVDHLHHLYRMESWIRRTLPTTRPNRPGSGSTGLDTRRFVLTIANAPVPPRASDLVEIAQRQGKTHYIDWVHYWVKEGRLEPGDYLPPDNKLHSSFEMPKETVQAVRWALQQIVDGQPVYAQGHVDRHLLVDTVRKYFNEHGIHCPPMNAKDLDPYLPKDSAPTDPPVS